MLGTTAFIGAGVGAAGAALSAWLLKTYPFPTNFAYTFAIAAAAISVSGIIIALTREPEVPFVAAPRSNRQYWSSLPIIVRQDDNFRQFLGARLLMALGAMGTGFITVAAVARWAVPDSTVAIFTGVLLVGQTASNLTFGWLADRTGHKLSLEAGALASFLAFAIAWLAPSSEWYFLVFALLGVTLGVILVSGLLIVMEFCEPERRPTYLGITNTGVGLVSIAAPLLGAWLASIGYNWLFAVGAAVNLAALITMRWCVRDPRWVGVEKAPGGFDAKEQRASAGR
jgi:Na+/melibiose symporter-like transporter